MQTLAGTVAVPTISAIYCKLGVSMKSTGLTRAGNEKGRVLNEANVPFAAPVEARGPSTNQGNADIHPMMIDARKQVMIDAASVILDEICFHVIPIIESNGSFV